MPRMTVMLGAAALVVLSCTLAFAEAESAAYWSVTLPMHPKLVHVPMALCVLMPAVAALAWLGIHRGWFTPRVWLLVAFLQFATLVGGAAALWSGLQDGEKVEGYASEEALETHEDRAYAFVDRRGGQWRAVQRDVLARESSSAAAATRRDHDRRARRWLVRRLPRR